jgi:hypothetical protein
MLPERADALMAAWEAEAKRRGLPDGARYADQTGWNWIAAQRPRPSGWIAPDARSGGDPG